MKKGILLLIVAIMPLFSLSAKEIIESDTVSVKVYFRQGYSLFEPSFRGNADRLEAFAERLREIVDQDTMLRKLPVRIIGAASPEGTSERNRVLAEKRAENLARWIESNLDIGGLTCETASVGVDWKGLTLLVEASEMPYKNEVLNILYNTPEWVIKDNKVVDGRMRQLGMLQGGRAWWYMSEHLFPDLRTSSVELMYTVVRTTREEPVFVADTVYIRDTVVVTRTVTVVDTVTVERERKPFYMALKTNMLYDAALIPNIGVEFYLGKGWTVGAGWMYAWWKSDRCHNYWRTYGGEVNIRKYFGKKAQEKPLQGHHLGVYGQMLTYDFELGGRGYLGDRWSWGAGIEYGYSLPVAERINIDFAIGIGYLGGEYKEYLPIDDHYVWQVTKQRHWIGPTKAEITLVWLLGPQNTNPKKGNRK